MSGQHEPATVTIGDVPVEVHAIHGREALMEGFAIEVEANVGRVEVTGPTGGVEAELNVGELRIDVPSGKVDARANVGEIKVLSATKSPGELRLSANIGNVDLRIGDKRVQADRGFALGGGVSASQGGKDDISAKVNVGDVSVRID